MMRLHYSVEQSLFLFSLAAIFIFHLHSTGNGVVIHIPQFFEELEALEAKGD